MRIEAGKLPKVELHRHIEGSVSAATIIRIARRHNLPLPTFDEEELRPLVSLNAPMSSLPDVLRMFQIAQSMFVSYEAIEEIVWEMLRVAYEVERVRLMELRYSPGFMHHGAGLDWRRSLEVINGTVARFQNHCGDDMACGVILIASRSYGMEMAERTADFAVACRDQIIGFDLADNEVAFPSRLYGGLARKLHDAGIPLTVHSGEEGTHLQILETLDHLAPRRIGHGVMAARDESGETIRRIREAGVTIETNPVSNWLTNAVPSLAEHPLPRFIKEGVSVSIGADDPDLLCTDLNREYSVAVEEMGLTLEDLRYVNRCAAAASFIDEGRKGEILRRYFSQ